MELLFVIAIVLACASPFAAGQDNTPSGFSTGSQSCSCLPACSAQGSASYSVEFDFTWPSGNYNVPPGPHWSFPVFTTHTPCAVVWRTGVLPTQGLEVLAEVGGTSTIASEISNFGGHRRSYVTANVLFAATGRRSGNVVVDNKRFLLSTLSMIAPSPDWFVGVDSVPLCVNDTFIASATYNLYPHDAGSDSGSTYTARDADLNPKINVSRIFPTSGTDVFTASGVASIPMGTLRITRTSVDSSTSAPANVMCKQCASTAMCRTGTENAISLELPTEAAATSAVTTATGQTVGQKVTSADASSATSPPSGQMDSTSSSGAMYISIFSIVVTVLTCLLFA